VSLNNIFLSVFQPPKISNHLQNQIDEEESWRRRDLGQLVIADFSIKGFDRV
jgi:hypothetical protein